MKKFRLLRADEIECRISEIGKKGDKLSLLLYKDARCDQNILDETVGAMNWQRVHGRDNANCTILIWDEDKKQWVGKEDTGTESYTEKEKGLASDSFKRAGFNWGIGRELYSAPRITVWNDMCNIKEYNGKWKCYDNFTVKEIEYDKNENISKLVIYNETKKCECFRFDETIKEHNSPERPIVCEGCGNEIVGYKGKNGKLVSVAKHVEASMKRFDKCLCLDCIRKAMSDEN